ncbi:MAG TPA: GAF domain-containing protein, partial [Alphaproteobacteria bacterium]
MSAAQALRTTAGMDLVYDLLDFAERLEAASPAALLEAILRKGGEIVGAAAGTAYLYRGGDGHRLTVACRLPRSAARPDHEVAIPGDSDALPAHVARSGKPAMIGDLARLPAGARFGLNHLPRGPAGAPPRSILCFPLTGATGGVLAVLEYAIYGEPRGARDGAHAQLVEAAITLFNRLLGRELERALLVERLSTQNRKLRTRSRKLSEHRAQIAHLQT